MRFFFNLYLIEEKKSKKRPFIKKNLELNCLKLLKLLKQIILTNLIKFIKLVNWFMYKIQKSFYRKKRGDRPPKCKANVQLSNTEVNQAKKRRVRLPKAKSALNIDKLIKMTIFYML